MSLLLKSINLSNSELFGSTAAAKSWDISNWDAAQFAFCVINFLLSFQTTWQEKNTDHTTLPSDNTLASCTYLLCATEAHF